MQSLWYPVGVAYVVRVNGRQEKQTEVVSVHERAINKQESHVNSEDSTDNELVSLFSRHLHTKHAHGLSESPPACEAHIR